MSQKISAVNSKLQIKLLAEIGSKFGFCSLNPASSIQLKSIGGRQAIESVPCDKNQTSTGQMLIKIVNHLNNEGYKNPYGHNSGLEGVHNGPMAYQASSGLWWQDLMIKGNNYREVINLVDVSCNIILTVK